jgi:antitoxin ParD1/3/4
MATMNISLPEKMKKRVRTRIATGNYANASDYVRDLIRQDIERRDTLVAELRKGERSGVSKRQVPEILATTKRARARSNG